MGVLKQLVGVDPLVLVLARIRVLLHHILVLEIVHGGTDKRASEGKMRGHAECLHVELPLLELLSDPAKDIASLCLGKLQEAGRELHLSEDVLAGEVEDEDHVRPFPAQCHLLPFQGLPLDAFIDGQPDIPIRLRMLAHNHIFLLLPVHH